MHDYDVDGLLSQGLCTRCLGRVYALLGHGLTNVERGKALLILHAFERGLCGERVDPSALHRDSCDICGGAFTRFSMYAEMVEEKLRDYEYETFLVGSRFPEEALQREREIQEAHGGHGESVKREFNREFGKHLEAHLGKRADMKRPHVTITVDTRYDIVRVAVAPVFVYGRYRKLVRGISQTRWPCPGCEGGKYGGSVEEYIGEVMKEVFRSDDYRLHGMGREDVDARMLGNGRPFVMELISPRRRTVDLSELEREINRRCAGRVEVTGLRYSDRAEVQRVKESRHRKGYEVGVEVDASDEEIRSALKSIEGKVIYQRTPLRVSHRRPDRVRERKVYEARLVKREGPLAVIRVVGDAGLYIKELMHGDGGRTNPSLAGLLGKDVKVKYLDVIWIYDQEE